MSGQLNYSTILKTIDALDAYMSEIKEFVAAIESNSEAKEAIKTITTNYREFLDKAMITTESLKEYYVGVINNATIDVYGNAIISTFKNYPIFPKEENESEESNSLSSTMSKE